MILYYIQNKTMQNEIWKKVVGFENYSVSDHCHVRDDKRGLLKKLSNHSQGYLETSLTKDKISKNYLVHQLVANAFLLNSDNKQTVDHIDNDKANNKVSNLRWASLSEQSQNRGI